MYKHLGLSLREKKILHLCPLYASGMIVLCMQQNTPHQKERIPVSRIFPSFNVRDWNNLTFNYHEATEKSSASNIEFDLFDPSALSDQYFEQTALREKTTVPSQNV